MTIASCGGRRELPAIVCLRSRSVYLPQAVMNWKGSPLDPDTTQNRHPAAEVMRTPGI